MKYDCTSSVLPTSKQFNLLKTFVSVQLLIPHVCLPRIEILPFIENALPTAVKLTKIIYHSECPRDVLLECHKSHGRVLS